ncbi:hypothetical protein EZE46_14750 [Bacillus sp. BH2]|uniref:hypothetical protein n=1 Tax=Bacillus sp. BH2 TaxID=2528958 RepID=UPI0010657AB7|nr:hypothetical protein [Bacillus sp. BH2]TEA49849.1 hypothetical protein EZE46_14750 [Bacillus sp. BH2]
MKKVKTVAFNMLDPLERRLYNHMRREMYFSKHIKRLIQRDIEEGEKVHFEGGARVDSDSDIQGK